MTKNNYQHLVYDHELMLYPFAPLGMLNNVGKWPVPQYKHSIIINVTAQDSNIAEWITYHRLLGFDHIYLYCTDEDPTDLYRMILPFTLGQKSFVTFHHYRFKDNSYFYHFLRNYVHETEWYIALTPSDYMCIRQNKSLDELMYNFKRVSFVYFNIVIYKAENSFPNSPLHTIDMAATPHYHTRIMVKTTSLPYQNMFEEINTNYYYHLHTLAPNTTACNVNFVEIDTYYKNFPSSILTYLENQEECRKILNTAYIATTKDPIVIFNDKDSHSVFYTPSLTNDVQNIKPSIQFKKDFYLKQYWKQSFHQLKNQAILPETNWLLLSENKPCSQIISNENSIETTVDAPTLVNGELTGFVSDQDTLTRSPTYIINLEKIFIIKEIRIFNKFNTNHTYKLTIKSSNNQQLWNTRYTKKDMNNCGGIDGNPLIWLHPLGFQAQFLKFEFENNDMDIALDQIQIFGIISNKL